MKHSSDARPFNLAGSASVNAKTNELSQINLLTIQEIADWARVSNKTVYRWISDHFNRQTTIGKPSAIRAWWTPTPCASGLRARCGSLTCT
jgi:predicted DNA-binding transcriptional regulator AlpA